ncbi:hypothetical protein ACVIGA_001822 [Bradyrhizobium sp. USDA 3240]
MTFGAGSNCYADCGLRRQGAIESPYCNSASADATDLFARLRWW